MTYVAIVRRPDRTMLTVIRSSDKRKLLDYVTKRCLGGAVRSERGKHIVRAWLETPDYQATCVYGVNGRYVELFDTVELP